MAAEEDFSPSRLSNLEMGYVYEELLRRFSEDDAKDTGEHFTPREIIRIMVDLLEIDFDPAETQEAISIYDPACGTGGMLSVAKEHLVDRADTEEEARQVEELVLLNGQEMLAQNYAVCKADMIIKGETGSNITHGNSLIPDIDSVQDDGDKHAGQQFDYMLSNPPFGVDWGDYSSDVNKLSKSRYRWGTPPSDNGAFLFLQTMIEKMKPVEEGGSKITILFNASPLSNGDATQSESEVRRHILENDLLDTIVMLPDQMFYDTGIYTYVWLLNNKKPEYKKDKVCLIDARDQFEKESSSFGEKRHRITDEQRKWIYNQFRNFEESKKLKLFSTKDFAYHKVKVVFWQEDENEEQMWVTEDLDVKLSTQNIKKRFELYGDLRVHVDLETPENDFHHFDIHYEGSKGFGPVFRDLIQETFEHLEDVKVSVVKDWLDKCTIKASFTHRHYIVDNEYIPFDLTAGDKSAYINDFLHSEINYKIISWEEYDQLGYEILPNLYFYEYEEPDPSEEIIKDFWALEEEAEKILSQIKNL
ncbi:MAG: N-6 DNA methylase [Balneolaceae bacterium]|nr:N-6 DNA methylase [Balneolaceae bacterium]